MAFNDYDPNKPGSASPTGSLYENSMAGLGKAFVDPWHRMQQAAGYRTQDQVDEDARLDTPLMHTAGGLGGNIAGQVIQSIPVARGVGMLGRGAAAVAPWLAKAPGWLRATGLAATQGAAQGAAAPVTTGSTAAGNIAGGAAAGVGGKALAAGATKFITPAARYATPYMQQLAAMAERYGIPVTADQLTNSAAGKAVASLAKNLPFSGGPAIAAQQGKGLTQMATSTFGPAENDAVKAVGNAKGVLGKEFDSISGRNKMYMTTGDADKLDAIPLTHLANTGNQAEAGQLQNVVDNIKAAHAKTGYTPGPAYQKLRSTMGRNQMSAPQGSEMSNSWKQVQSTLDDAMYRSMPANDQASYAFLRSQYGNMKDVEKMLPTSGEGYTTGALDPKKMVTKMAAPTAKNGPNATAMQQGLGQDPLADAAQVGNAFVPRAPNTEVGGVHMPYGDVLKSLGPQLGATAAAGATGFGLAHLSAEDSEFHKNPFYTAMGAAGAAAALGGTGGRLILSQAYKNGMPAVVDAIEKASKLGITSSGIAAAAPRTAASMNPSRGGFPAYQSNDPFASMERVPPEAMDPISAAGLQRAPAPVQ